MPEITPAEPDPDNAGEGNKARLNRKTYGFFYVQERG
jgi:hypothetical protein